MPARGASAGDGKATVRPARAISPASAGNTPVMILTSVLLPAPFAPMSACASPARTSKSAERSALTAPNVFATPRMCRSGGASFMISYPKQCRRLAPPALQSAIQPRSRAFARDQLLGRVMGIGRHGGDAEIGVELRIVRGFERTDALTIVPDGRRDFDQVRLFLFRQDVEGEAQARGPDGRRVADRGASQSLVFLVDELADEAVVVRADHRHVGLARGLVRVDDGRIDARCPDTVDR